MKRILVVDDDPGILEAIEFMLDYAGYEVIITRKGEEAFEKAIETMPDLIVLDMLLSGMDGRNIVKKLKSYNNTKHIPILMMSAHPTAESLTIESGANAFVSKPFNMD